MTMSTLPNDETERRRLGEKLRQAREYLGFSQDDVATFLKLPRTAITNIESGQRKVEALELKGKQAPVEAFVLVSVAG